MKRLDDRHKRSGPSTSLTVSRISGRCTSSNNAGQRKWTFVRTRPGSGLLARKSSTSARYLRREGRTQDDEGRDIAVTCEGRPLLLVERVRHHWESIIDGRGNGVNYCRCLMAYSVEPSATGLPAGAALGVLSAHHDERGWLVEIDRHSSHTGAPRPVQWNVMVSSANSLRGMHVHLQHTDWVTVVETARQPSASLICATGATATVAEGCWWSCVVNGARCSSIPPGVLHGFFTADHSVLLNGLSLEYDPSDDVAVRYNDVALGIDWGIDAPILSDRDRNAPDLETMFRGLAERGADCQAYRCERGHWPHRLRPMGREHLARDLVRMDIAVRVAEPDAARAGTMRSRWRP